MGRTKFGLGGTWLPEGGERDCEEHGLVWLFGLGRRCQGRQGEGMRFMMAGVRLRDMGWECCM